MTSHTLLTILSTIASWLGTALLCTGIFLLIALLIAFVGLVLLLIIKGPPPLF